MALLATPSNPAVAEAAASQMQAGARRLGLELSVLNASTESDFEAVFAKIGLLRASGLVISAGDPFFVSRRGQLAALAARHAVPAVAADREFVTAGGLVSYRAGPVGALHLTGRFLGRVLKGLKPGD